MPIASLPATPLRMTDCEISLITGHSALLTLLHSRHLHSGESSREAFFAHIFEHLLHLGVLAQEIVYFLDRGARASGNAFAAAAVDYLMMIALVHRHGVDDGFNPIHLLFVYLVGGFLEAREWAD